jgi:uncharacterized membrane protein
VRPGAHPQTAAKWIASIKKYPQVKGPAMHPGIIENRSQTDNTARYAALLTGGAIALFGLTQKSKTRIALVGTGATIASFAMRDQVGDSSSSASEARSTIIVNIPPERAYSYWRDFSNLATFMNHLKSVQVTDPRHSRWTAYGPLSKEVQWDAEITDERENELIAWRSIEGSDVNMEGLVQFSRATGGRGTLIEVSLRYEPPAGAVGSAAMKLLGKDPSFLMRQDMRRFKALLEAGEIPTTDGQSHGPRDAVAHAFQAINPDEPVKKSMARSTGARRRRAS